MSLIETPAPISRGPERAGETPHAGRWLVLWAAMIVVLNAAAWITGLRGYALAEAVESGAAHAEADTIGEVPEEAIRKAIQTQRDSRTFWSALVLLDDFGIEPLLPAIRATCAATILAGLALLGGRRARYADALGGCAVAQGFWVMGLAVRIGLMVYLRRPQVETSATLLLAPGAYPAAVWVALAQADAFALIGWLAIARAGWRKAGASVPASIGAVVSLWLLESSIRIALTLFVGAGMRLTLIPETA